MAFWSGASSIRPPWCGRAPLPARWGVHPHEVMIANGWLEAEDYYRALAERCAAPFKIATGRRRRRARGNGEPAAKPGERRAQGTRAGRTASCSRPIGSGRTRLREMLARLSPYGFSLASPQRGERRDLSPFRSVLRASCHRRPRLAPSRHERADAPGAMAAPNSAVRHARADSGDGASTDRRPYGRSCLLSLFCSYRSSRFAWLRLACLLVSDKDDARAALPRVPDHELPIYTLLVPLYREAHMLPALIAALTRLDYPAAKLDIKLILEAADGATMAAARALRLPGNVEIVVVPELHPRTKPKALNYALPLARGEYVVIYDAEDRPEPGQLRASPQCLPRRSSQPGGRAGAAQSLQRRRTAGSPASSPSSIARCSTGSCRRLTGSNCPFRSAGHPIIFAPRRWCGSWGGTRSMSPRTPISA